MFINIFFVRNFIVVFDPKWFINNRFSSVSRSSGANISFCSPMLSHVLFLPSHSSLLSHLFSLSLRNVSRFERMFNDLADINRGTWINSWNIPRTMPPRLFSFWFIVNSSTAWVHSFPYASEVLYSCVCSPKLERWRTYLTTVVQSTVSYKSIHTDARIVMNPWALRALCNSCELYYSTTLLQLGNVEGIDISSSLGQ